MLPNDKIYIVGHRGMVGSAIWSKLQQEGFTWLIGKTSAELDLKNQVATQTFFEKERPDYVFLAAAKVGGILANNVYRGEFLYDNLMTRAMRSMRPTGMESKSSCSWAPPVSTQNWRRSR